MAEKKADQKQQNQIESHASLKFKELEVKLSVKAVIATAVLILLVKLVLSY